MTGGRVLSAVAAAALAAAALALPAAPAGARTPAVPPLGTAGEPDDMQLLGQVFDLPVDGELTITLGMPQGVDAAELAAAGGSDDAATVTVTSHRALRDRPSLLLALDGDPPREEDSVEATVGDGADEAAATRADADGTPRTADVIAATTTAPRATAEITPEGLLLVRIPTESQRRSSGALQFEEAGVHPVTIELRVGPRRHTTSTFVHRLPAPDDDPDGPLRGRTGAMAVGIVMRHTLAPTVDGDGAPAPSAADVAQLRRLADALTAMDDAAAALGRDPRTVPRAVGVEPSVLQAVGETDPELAARLGGLLTESDVIARPRLPLDPGVAAAAGQVGVELYTQWLRQGEDRLVEMLPGAVVDRTMHVVDGSLTDGGAILRRNLGTRLLVMPFDTFASTTGATGYFTDTTQLLTVDLPDGSTLPTAVVDPYLGARLDDGADAPLATAIDVMADLLVIATSIDAEGGAVGRHGVVLGASQLGVMDPAVVAQLTSLLLASPALRLVDPAALGSIVDTWLIDGRLGTISLPVAPSVDRAPRFETVAQLRADASSYASMLTPGHPSVARWEQVLGALPSTAVTEAQAASMVRSVEAEFAELRDGVVVEASSFTLTGRRSQLRFGLLNTTDELLRVRVNLSSPKLRFPNGDVVVDLPPNSDTDVKVEAEALSNGTSSVFLRVYAPDETRQVAVGPEVVLTARVTSFAGAAQLVTGAAALLVLTWWLRHWRTSRRRQLAAPHTVRHPASRAGDDTGPARVDAGGGEVAGAAPVRPPRSPDAEASSVQRS